MGLMQLIYQTASMASQSVEGVLFGLIAYYQEQAAAGQQQKSNQLAIMKAFVDAYTQGNQQQNTKLNSIITDATQNYGDFLNAVTEVIKDSGKSVSKMIEWNIALVQKLLERKMTFDFLWNV